MFDAYDFTFAGTPCSDFGLMLYNFDGESQSDITFGNEGNIIETRTTHRIQPIHHGVNYHEEPLQFDLVFGALEPLSRDTIQNVMYWLTGYQDYQWLSIAQDDLSGIEYRCLITEVELLTDNDLPYAFRATVTCDCPYAYGPTFSKTSTIQGTTSVSIDVNSSVRDYIKPTITYTKSSGVTQISIKNTTDNNREFVLDNLPSASGTITIDCNSSVITHTFGNIDIYSGYNGNMFRLMPGSNSLSVKGNGTLVISGRTLHNVGA